MRYFLILLHRSRILLLFILLEAIAVYWVVSAKSYPRAQFNSVTTEINGRISNFQDDFQSYLNLRIENAQLAEENRRLREQLNESLLIQNYGADTINDSVLNQRYTYLPAKVIHSSHLKASNYLIIDKGSRSGVKPHMGVIGPLGVVGMVSSVSSNFARVIPLINNSLSISAALKSEGYFGPLKWPGEDYLISQVTDIPRYSNVKAGDTLITDGRSRYFPPGISIGVVESKTLQADQNFFSLEVALSTDFANIAEVYVVKDLFGAELDTLQNPAIQ